MLKKIKHFILDLLFPPYCVACKREGYFLCEACLKNLSDQPLKPYRAGHQKRQESKDLDGVIYALDYAKNPVIKLAIRQFKYRFTQEIADDFGRLMAKKIGQLKMARHRQIILIPVPLHKKRLFYRGFNQAERIAEAVKRQMSHDQGAVLHLLERVKHTEQQARLNKKERGENLANAFILNKNCIHKYAAENLYFLVDDVSTTGTTLKAGAAVLKNHGFAKVYGLVLARAMLKQ